eukprot:Hpha_TRINITY_DN16823_c1_g3::TRINITY_DN16823_c1_g3_i1::g.150362::m.150362
MLLLLSTLVIGVQDPAKVPNARSFFGNVADHVMLGAKHVQGITAARAKRAAAERRSSDLQFVFSETGCETKIGQSSGLNQFMKERCPSSSDEWFDCSISKEGMSDSAIYTQVSDQMVAFSGAFSDAGKYSGVSGLTCDGRAFDSDNDCVATVWYETLNCTSLSSWDSYMPNTACSATSVVSFFPDGCTVAPNIRQSCPETPEVSYDGLLDSACGSSDSIPGTGDDLMCALEVNAWAGEFEDKLQLWLSNAVRGGCQLSGTTWQEAYGACSRSLGSDFAAHSSGMVFQASRQGGAHCDAVQPYADNQATMIISIANTIYGHKNSFPSCAQSGTRNWFRCALDEQVKFLVRTAQRGLDRVSCLAALECPDTPYVPPTLIAPSSASALGVSTLLFVCSALVSFLNHF